MPDETSDELDSERFRDCRKHVGGTLGHAVTVGVTVCVVVREFERSHDIHESTVIERHVESLVRILHSPDYGIHAVFRHVGVRFAILLTVYHDLFPFDWTGNPHGQTFDTECLPCLH